MQFHLENLTENYKIILTIVSTGLLLIPLIIFLKKFEREKQKRLIDKLALSIYNMYQNLIVTDFDLISIDSKNFDSLDLNFYNSVSSDLMLKHFQIIGDFEESNIKKINPSVITFSRFLISEDRTIKATIYQLKIGGASFKSCEFLTEFIDGTVLITSNNVLNTKIEYPSEIVFSFNNTESPDDLLKHHENGINQINASKNSALQKISNVEEIMQQNKRVKLIENQFRKTIKKQDILKELSRFCSSIKNENTLSKIADRIIEMRMK